MNVPTTAAALGVYLGLIVPGVVFVAVRVRMRGHEPSDTQTGSQLLLAFIVSVAFDAVYALFLGGLVVQRLLDARDPSPSEVTWWAVAYLCLAILIPTAVGVAFYSPTGPVAKVREWIRTHTESLKYEATPTAWDYATTSTKARWVRVRTAPGEWVGGVYGPDSYFGTYPQPRDLFIQESWRMGSDGRFVSRVKNTAGVWVAIHDDYIVEWLLADEVGTAASSIEGNHERP